MRAVFPSKGGGSKSLSRITGDHAPSLGRRACKIGESIMTRNRQFLIDLNNDISFKNKSLTKAEIVENKMVRKIDKHRYKFGRKMSDDIVEISRLVNGLGDGESMDLMSKAFDSPTLVLAFKERIRRLFVATWAITPAGISALEEITRNGVIEECWVMLDMTHSYKWIFTSDAYKILRGKVKFKFLATHAKFICAEMTDGSVLNFVGSMNFSNNPRYENIQITKDRDDFEFYASFIRNTYAQTI